MRIELEAEFLFELASKQDWVNNVPQILPKKIRPAESWVWLDVNGHVFEIGVDFEAAEKQATYPCKVYRLISVSSNSSK